MKLNPIDRINKSWNLFSISFVIFLLAILLIAFTVLSFYEFFNHKGSHYGYPPCALHAHSQPVIDDSVEISIYKDGDEIRHYYNHYLVEDIHMFSKYLSEHFKKKNRKKLLLRIKDEVNWKHVRKILSIVKESGFQEVGMLSRGKSSMADLLIYESKKKANKK